MAAPVLAVRDVRKSYGNSPALRGVDVDVHPGELFGLLGPNGAGKTTLMGLLAGLGSPDAGEIRLFGESFRAADLDQRRLIGLATQDLAVYPELTARENVQFFGRLYGLRGAELRERSAEVLRAVALEERAGDRAGTFSGGMKRRLNLAVAIVHRPRVLLLDEPTTGVDPQSRNHIFERVQALNRAGLTVVYTSHYMEEVQALCPRIAVLDGGRIVACDTIAELLSVLPQTATLRFAVPPGGDLVASLATLPGVSRAEPSADGVLLSGPDLAAALPKAVAACYAAGAEPAALDVDRPNLERVFLHLTGHGLRD